MPVNTTSPAPRAVVSARELVGRADELTALVATVTRPPALAVLEGEAGIGKTRLVHELRDSGAVTSRVALGACRQIREPFPLGPLLEAVRDLVPGPGERPLSPVAGALRPLLPEISGSLPPPLPPTGDRASERHRVFRGLTEILDRAGPVVVVLEDLHWADKQTIDYLAFVLADPPPRLSIVLTFRDDQVDRALRCMVAAVPTSVRRVHISVQPLDRRHTGALAAAILGRDRVPASFAACLHYRTDGLPLAIEELVALLPPAGDDRLLARSLDDLEVPHAIRDPLLERVERLPAATRPVMQALAVLQQPHQESVIAAMAPAGSGDEVPDGLSHGIEAGLLVEQGGAVGFRHVLASQAVYDAIPGPRRRQLHDRAAAALVAAGASLGEVAHHLRSAGRLAQWAETAERAADQATALGHDDEAVRLLEDVLRHAPLPARRRGEMAGKLAQAAVEASRGADVLRLLGSVLDDPHVPADVRGELRVRVAVLLDHTGGDLSVRHQLLTRAVEELRHRPDLRAWAMFGLGIPRASGLALPENLRWLHRCLEILTKLNDPEFDTYLRAKVALVLAIAGDPGWLELSAQVLYRTGGRPDTPQEVFAYESLAMADCYTGHHRRAGQVLRAAEQTVGQLGGERPALVLGCTRALLDFCQGRWQHLADRLETLRGRLEGQPRYLSDVEVVAGCLSLARDGPYDAVLHLRPVVDQLYRMGAVELVPLPASALVRAELGRGDPDAAVVQADRLLGSLPRGGAWVPAVRAVPALASAFLAAGRDRDATALTDELTGFTDHDMPLATPVRAQARGLVAAAAGRSADAVPQLCAAATGYEAALCPYEAAQAREQAAEVLLAAGLPGAEQPLRTAMVAYQRLNAGWDLDRAAQLGRRHGLRPPSRHRRGRRGYGADLSPRERQVATLAATGRTNKEIARELYVQPDTVKKHLYAAMRKLDVHTRAALVHRLADPAVAKPFHSSTFVE